MSTLASSVVMAPLPKEETFAEDMGSDLWTNSKYKDYQIVVDDRVLLVHKCVLAARSPVFNVMLTSGRFTESQSGQLVIQDSDFDTVEMALKFFYSEYYDIKISSIWNLMAFGNKYDIQHLINACLHKIKIRKDDYDNSQIKSVITSAVNLKSDKILELVLNIFGATKGELVPDSCPYPGLGEALAKDDSFKDLKIICGGQEFLVHKCIFALASPVFAQMLDSDSMVENGDTSSGQLIIDRIKPIVFENALEFFYTGYITQEFDRNPQLFLGLLEFADKFKAERLVTWCLEQINIAKKEKFVSQNVIAICIETAGNFESKKILDFLLGILGAHDAEKFNFDHEKTSMKSYWN